MEIIYKFFTGEILEASVHQLFVMMFAVFTSAKFVRKADRIMITQSINWLFTIYKKIPETMVSL